MRVAAATQTRAGRLRIASRLELARHAAGLLHSKEEALERERVRLDGHATRAQAAWTSACDDAARELVRARMFGAGDELARLIASGPTPATFTPHWQTSMGVAYPGAVECEPGPLPALGSTAALVPAVDAYRRALRAAAQHAAAGAAVRCLTAELAQTRRRRRAIEHRLQPALERAQRELDLHLDELDRDEALRVRIARDHQEADRT